MSTSYDGIEDLLKTLDKLQKNLDRLKGAREEKPNANPSFEQSPHDGTTQSLNTSDLNTSGKDVTVCNKCHNKGHLAASCRSSWTKEDFPVVDERTVGLRTKKLSSRITA
jgi:hypothetical protein